MTALLHSIETGTSDRTLAKMLGVLYPDAETILDATWGSGKFWTGPLPSGVRVIGADLDPARARDVVADFTQLPFGPGAVDLVVYDPPFISDVSKTNPGVIGRRFSSYASDAEARRIVQAGAAEAWRVARVGVIAKCQIHTHGSLTIDMEGWLREAVPSPIFGRVEQLRRSKIVAPNWGEQLSVRSNSSTFLAFRKGSQRHVRRGAREERRSA
jgi:hypothetical protein